MKPVVQTAFFLFVLLGLSSLYFAAAEKIQSLCPLQYPTDYLFEWECVRLSSKDTPSLDFRHWIHGRDLPGYPASHGCIGLYDEEMQKEYYGEPEWPVLTDPESSTNG